MCMVRYRVMCMVGQDMCMRVCMCWHECVTAVTRASTCMFYFSTFLILIARGAKVKTQTLTTFTYRGLACSLRLRRRCRTYHSFATAELLARSAGPGPASLRRTSCFFLLLFLIFFLLPAVLDRVALEAALCTSRNSPFRSRSLAESKRTKVLSLNAPGLARVTDMK